VQLPEDSVNELLALTGLVLTQGDLPGMLSELCRVAVRAVPNAEGASVTTFNDGKPSALASDDWAKGFDELQYVEHEGPCLDAYRTGNAFRIRDLAAESRWPSYCPQAVERGARSMVSLPLAAEGQNVGALNLYAAKPDAFDADIMSVAEIVAAHVGLAIQVGAALFGHRDLHEQLSEAIKSRGVIEQAKGILMGERRCSADEAFQILTRLSQDSNTKLRDVAAALVNKATTLG
jgi:transcriptional regulator with GAF, ATPase, and Fis domain